MGYELKIFVGNRSHSRANFVLDEGNNWRDCHSGGNGNWKWFQADGETSHVIKDSRMKKVMQPLFLRNQSCFSLGKVLGSDDEKLWGLNKADESPEYYVYDHSGMSTITDCYGDFLRVREISSVIEALEECHENMVKEEHSWWPLDMCIEGLKAARKSNPDLICVLYGY